MTAEHESLLDSLDAAERAWQELDGRLKAVSIQASRHQRQLRCVIMQTSVCVLRL